MGAAVFGPAEPFSPWSKVTAGLTISHPDDVKIVEAALMAEGLLSPAFAQDGSHGTVTLTAYSQWQRQQGFTGEDADGVPGGQTLKVLGGRHGFRVID